MHEDKFESLREYAFYLVPLTFCQLPSTGVMLFGNGGSIDSARVCFGSGASCSTIGREAGAWAPNKRAPTVSSKAAALNLIDM